MFNYSTGPVELDEAVKEAMAQAPSSSHSSAGQRLVQSAVLLGREVLAVPADFDLFLLPGSIRQTLDTLMSAITPPGASVLAYTNGYWGEFIAGLVDTSDRTLHRADPHQPVDLRSAAVVTAVHMETETGLLQPLEHLREHRAAGATVLIDAACTIPVHGLNYDDADIVVAGSHKCLGAAPGLGIVAVRRTIWRRRSWSLDAYWRDSDSVAPRQLPLVTYPINVVASLEASLRMILGDATFGERRAEAAYVLRTAVQALGFVLHRGDGEISDTVTRIDLPDSIDAEMLRRRLAEDGFFVIGNVGAGAGSSIRIGTMSNPQCNLGNLNRLVESLGRACSAASAVRTNERV